MDRNTIIGLVLIGLILSVFTIFNQPSEEELKQQKAKIEKAEKEREKKENTRSKKETVEKVPSSWILKKDENGEKVKDSTGAFVYTDTLRNVDTVFRSKKKTEQSFESPKNLKGELVRMENEKLIVDFNTLGGQVAAVRLKGFENYEDFAKKDGKVTPLTLFREGDARNGLIIPVDGRELKTAEHLFRVTAKDDRSITFSLERDGEIVEFRYTLKPNAFDLDYDITLRGFAGKTSPKNVMLDWSVAYQRTERLFSEQRRVSTVCYDYKNEGFSYLSEMADDEIAAEDDINWVSYKQSYFSSFMKPEVPFGKSGSRMEVVNYEEGHEKEFTNLKDYNSLLNLNLKSVDNSTVRINWFFGPNDFKVLNTYDKDYDKILNYGWGLFRWINLYAVQPVFSVLKSTGLNIGIVILLLTIVLKLLLMPIQWKMYTSSAKMRILKPEIDELNAKYPNKEDAMKKQMEMMSLYRESGASPFAGCVPMLIQMPILLAVFRFFPATFDLRQKSFLWAEDLSSYDSIYDFGFNIWLYGDHISLFTLLMAATTLVYTWINSGNMQQPSQPGMPNMKVIMYIFPVLMIFFFNNYSSGLSYYYFISTLISILIMLAIKQFFVDEEKLKAKMAARKAAASANPSKAKKSKFQERLEQMQKAQMDQMKNKKK
jgi:YidC/Oxa1 family membrane protein insertase